MVKVFVPKEALQEAHRQLEGSVRVLCVYWDEKDRRWSTEGLTTNHTKSYVICESSHMTAFSILFDVSPRSVRDETHESILTIISYIGSTLSIIGLCITILSYTLFRCLNRDHPGKILIQLCCSLLSLNTTFLLEALVPSNGKHFCAAIAMLLHYLVLSSLSWMCVEATNMYHLLVYVFGSYETHFMLKRCLFGWGFPLIFVAFTSIFELDSYYVGNEFCMLSSTNQWVYNFTFVVPSCSIMGINFVIFLLVSRVIFTPRLAANNVHSSLTMAQTGKLKKHRGVLPPGTVSFSTSQGPRNLNNASQSSARAPNEESPKIAFDGSLFNKNPEIMENCLMVTPTSPGHMSFEDFRSNSQEKILECTPRFIKNDPQFPSNDFDFKKDAALP
ncbi:adhesion G-protein coupled receptor G6 [Caerostris extrusa]|uniref:Adhesion G-protein coupled receptor G6 n=1 Tax=Caerostris extrusa TaxID=172846 RepID=A0AAV4P738_CAEEX|nr:adhesion G-protein coupled receptor G6 [Caerostris extrusa]